MIFIGLCIDAGGYVFNTLYVLFYNPIGVNQFWNRMDMSGIYEFNNWYFIFLLIITIVVSIIKCFIFYIIVKIFVDKQLNFTQPFNKTLGNYLVKITKLALSVAVVSNIGTRFYDWLIEQSISLPSVEQLRFDGDDEWFFMAVILYVFSQIFKKGIELQSENELTV